MSAEALNPLLKTSDLVAQPAGATTDLLGTRLLPPSQGQRLSITVALDGASKFGVTVKLSNSGSALGPFWFHDNAALSANTMYTFIMGCRGVDSYNFQLDTGGVNVKLFYVEAAYAWI